MTIYNVKLEAFGYVRVWNYEAASEDEAVRKAQEHAGYSVEVKEQPNLTPDHTGGVVGRRGSR